MTISEKSAYLKGLAEGMALDPSKPEVKLINAVIDLLKDITDEVDDIRCDVAEANDYIEELDADLGDVEELIYEDDEDGIDSACSICGGSCGDDEQEFRTLLCPNCNEEICFDETINPEELVCPACGKAVCCDEDESEEV